MVITDSGSREGDITTLPPVTMLTYPHCPAAPMLAQPEVASCVPSYSPNNLRRYAVPMLTENFSPVPCATPVQPSTTTQRTRRFASCPPSPPCASTPSGKCAPQHCRSWKFSPRYAFGLQGIHGERLIAVYSVGSARKQVPCATWPADSLSPRINSACFL